eukprot:s572_g20.t1
MRGIMLIDVLGKVAQSLLRQRFLPTLQSWRHPLQLGGFPKCSTLFATQYLRAFHDRTRALHLPAAVLFVDVKSAFHSMVRQLLFGGVQQLPAHLCHLLREVDCDPDQLMAEFARTSAAFLAGVSPCDRKLLQGARQFTWFRLAGTDSAYCTSRGSRPGSPLADVAFNGMMVQVLQDLHVALQQVSGLRDGLLQLELPAPPVTWVDDVAVPVVTCECALLEPTLTQIAELTVEVFRRHGLVINFGRRKTEAVVTFRAGDAPQHRTSLFVNRMGHILLPTVGQTLRCVAEYEHLGTIFAGDRTLQCELVHRRQRALKAYRQVGKSVLRNRHVGVATRLKLSEALIVPILLHGAGNWGMISKRCFQSLRSCIMTWQRSIVNDGFWTADQLTDFELQCKWKLPSLALRLAKARLLYAFHCFQDGPGLLVDYVTATAPLSGSWFEALRQALRWVATMDPVFCAPDLVDGPIHAIVQWFTLHRHEVPRKIRRLYKKDVFQAHVLGDALSLHKQLQSTLMTAGVIFAGSPQPATPDLDAFLHCDWCERFFDTQQTPIR